MNSEFQQNRVLLVIIAAIFGLVGAAMGSERYRSEIIPAVTVETDTEIPAGPCKAKFAFKIAGKSFRGGQTLLASQCQDLYPKLKDPKFFLKFSSTEVVKLKKVVEPAKTVQVRDYSKEVMSRAIRFVICAAFGIFAGVLIFSHKRVRTLLDFRFEKFHTPVIIRIVYLVSVVFIVIGGVAWGVLAIRDVESDPFSNSSFLMRSSIVVVTVVGVALIWLIVRLSYEAVLVIFRISEDLRKIRERQSQS